MVPGPSEESQVPDDWDLIDDDPGVSHPQDGPPTLSPDADAIAAAVSQPAGSMLVSLLAAAWADAVTVLVIVTGCVGVLVIRGYGPTPAWLPWAGGAGVAWWLFAAGILLLVRRATPGMLLAGLQFERPVAPVRVGLVLLMAVIGAASLGVVVAIGGRRRGPLALAAGSPIMQVPPSPDWSP